MDHARHVTLKLQRAQEHIEHLGREVGAFYATRPYRVAHRRDPVSKRLTYYWTMGTLLDLTPQTTDALDERLPWLA